MRRLLLLRHGKAAQQSAGGDRERPLTRRGLADAHRVGEFLVAQGMTPELAVASNARRARQTLERVLEAFPVHVTHLIENSIYSASVDHLLDILRQSPEKVVTMLVVGHNPGFCELADALARLASTLDQARSNVEEAHRQHRRDLVPIQNTIVEFIEARRRLRESP